MCCLGFGLVSGAATWGLEILLWMTSDSDPLSVFLTLAVRLTTGFVMMIFEGSNLSDGALLVLLMMRDPFRFRKKLSVCILAVLIKQTYHSCRHGSTACCSRPAVRFADASSQPRVDQLFANSLMDRHVSNALVDMASGGRSAVNSRMMATGMAASVRVSCTADVCSVHRPLAAG